MTTTRHNFLEEKKEEEEENIVVCQTSFVQLQDIFVSVYTPILFKEK
jgi:hypothetical protein